MENALLSSMNDIRKFYETGATRSYEFRKEQLVKLKKMLLEKEQEIYDALFTDLKKNKEEAYATELGFVLSELNLTLNNLKRWMQPKTVSSDLVNLPSSNKMYCDSLGVVLLIGPWNYPLQLTLIPLIGAIAGGNCVVVKPSEVASATDKLISKIVSSLFASNYVRVISGDGATIIPPLLRDFRFDHIFYTGGTAVGKAVYKMAAEHLTPVTLELGGKSPCIVEADADIKVAAKRIVLGKFVNAGQTCIAPDYLLVHTSIKEKLIAEIKSTILKFYSKDSNQSVEYGKIINEKQFDRLVTYLQHGTILVGGRNNQNESWMEPTIMDNVSLDSPLMTEEIFGPILPVISFETTEEAIRIVHRNPNPLSFYVFTSSDEKEKQWIENIHFGGGCVNNTAWHFANKKIPFGGVGYSGMGTYHGKHTFDTFTRLKPVMKTPTWFDPALKYPPFSGKMKLLKRIIN